MAERKPGNLDWESFVDRQIREAEERGEFDNLPGSGKPLPGYGESYDPDWWLKQFLSREGLSVLPDTLRLKKFVEEERGRLLASDSEEAVRRGVGELNRTIAREIGRATSGPTSTVSLLSEEEFVGLWRETREGR